MVWPGQHPALRSQPRGTPWLAWRDDWRSQGSKGVACFWLHPQLWHGFVLSRTKTLALAVPLSRAHVLSPAGNLQREQQRLTSGRFRHLPTGSTSSCARATSSLELNRLTATPGNSDDVCGRPI